MDIKIPELGESITEGTISAWMVKEGENVKFGDLLLELETDKVNLEITATSDGVLNEIHKQAGETVEVGESVGLIRVADDDETSEDTDETKDNRQSSVDHNNDKVINASPSVRKLAREKGVDLNRLSSSDPKARITRTDIEAHNSEETAKKDEAAESDHETVHSERPVKRKRMSRRRMTIAKHLVEAQRTAAMLTTFNEVDMSAIIDIRKRRKKEFLEKHDVGLGFMSFFAKAVVGALKSFPMLNAEIDGEEIVEKQYYDIGIAVSAKEGLVVPVVRNVDQLSFAKIEKRIGELAERSKTNKLALSDLQGGTFTITNGGVFGSLLSTPILNTPQVGILGMHTIQKRPVAINDDKIENRPMMYIALSYDHRIVDGSEAVRFLVTVKELLEVPNRCYWKDRRSEVMSKKENTNSHTNHNGEKKKKWKRSILFILFLFIIFIVFTLIYSAIILSKDYKIDELALEVDMNSIVYDDEGNEIRKLYSSENREVVKLDTLPEHLKNSFIYTEDKRFKSHFGIDIKGILRAVWIDVKTLSLAEGASTITQQLVKNAYLTNDKTITRKLKEALISIHIERNYSKDQILEMYLNRIYFGHGAYGVQAASELYFNKDASELNIAESAMLASLPKAPNTYSPFRNPEKAKERRRVVLSLLKENNTISAGEEEEANKSELVSNDQPIGKESIYQTYIDYIVDEAIEQFNLTEDEVYRGGYHIYTNLDAATQIAMEETFAHDDLFINEDAQDRKVEAGMVSINPSTGGCNC